MATTRIKDLSKTATTLAADSNFVIDGSTNGTQKITTGNVKADIATSFAGDLSTYGIATLGSDNKLNPDQLPDSVTNGINFVGTADSGSDLTSTTQGDFYIVNTAFTHLSISYAVGDSAVYNGSAYVKVTPGTTQIGEGGTGASTLDGAKANLEIPDVGTSPQEVPLNGMLGSMAYQDADSVSVAELQVESTTGTATTQALTVTDGTDTNFVVQEGGSVGVGLSSPSGSGWDESSTVLHVKKGDTSGGLLALESSNTKAILNAGNNQLAVFTTTADPIRLGTSGSEAVRIDSSQRVGIGTDSPGYTLDVKKTDAAGDYLYVGASSDGGQRGLKFTSADNGIYLGAAHTIDAGSSGGSIALSINGTPRWTINSSGNLVANSTGIDFGSGGASSLLDDYERGTGDPTDESGAGLTFAGRAMNYVKIGSQVTVYVTLTFPTTSDTSTAVIGSLPFAFGSSNVDRIGGVAAYSTYAGTITALGVTGTGRVNFISDSLTLTNANLSGKIIWFSVTYDVS